MIGQIPKNHVAPLLNPLGFKKRGLVWNRKRDEFVEVITIQKAKHSTSHEQSITGNVGICVPEFYRIVFGRFPAEITEAECTIRVRFGELAADDYSGRALDQWWDVTPANTDEVGAQLRELVASKAIPFLESFAGFDSIPRHLDQLRGWLSKDPYTQISKALTHWKLGNLAKCEVVLSSVKNWPDKVDELRNWIQEHPRLISPIKTISENEEEGMSTNDWSFSDPPNVAVFTDKRILEKAAWIYYVGHDADDGAWQFHGPDGHADEANAKIVSLKRIVELDGSVADLADLPLGWCAWRQSPQSEWVRAPQE